MKKSVFKIALTLLLVFIISFSSVSVSVRAASNTTAAQEKKLAKKMYKYLVNNSSNNDSWESEVTYKKTGKKYTFTVTMTSKQMSMDYIKGAAFVGGDNYQTLLKALCDKNKKEYKKAKSYKLKKPVVYLVWMSSDNQKVATIKNGSIQ